MSVAFAKGSHAEAASLVDRISCPHCGNGFPPERLHFIARSPGLAYDHRLPEGAMRRFLPTHFTFQGDAVDAGGATCSETACPECHLKVPVLMALRKSLPLSIFGSPSSGKSYLLGAMSHELRKRLGSSRLRFDDVDTEANAILLDYERRMFVQPTPQHWVYLEKTGEFGDWYSDVWFGARIDKNKRTFPKPFLYRLDPVSGHPEESNISDVARVICLFDNAGEHYQAGGDKYNLVTGHLERSQGMIFVFDPTQDQAFRKACREKSSDGQFKDTVVDRQDILYGNVMNRILTLRSLPPTERVNVPLVVALTKFDAWRFLLGTESLPDVFREVKLPAGGVIRAFDPRVVADVSRACRDLLQHVSPELLATIESRCNPAGITFLPVSATGGPSEGKTDAAKWTFGSEAAPPNGYDYFLAGKIAPIWADVPMLTILHRCVPRLVPTVQR